MIILVRFVAYCGMSGIPHEFDTMPEARQYVARRLGQARKEGFPVATLDKGKEWEIQEREDAAMVDDACGTLSLETEEDPEWDDEEGDYIPFQPDE